MPAHEALSSTQTDRFRRSHVLLTLGALFLIAGATRLLPNGIAQASAPSEPTLVSEDTADPVSEVSEIETAELEGLTLDSPTHCLDDGNVALTGAIDWEAFEAREAEYIQKNLELQSFQTALEMQTRELESLQATLDERWADLQAVAGEDAAHLAKMYSVMKPDQAAAIFNEMDPLFSAGLLRELSGDQAGLILANMDAEKAYIITVRLAGRSADIRSAVSEGPAPSEPLD